MSSQGQALPSIITKKEKFLNTISAAINQSDLYPNKNSICFCGSGKRYKNCCREDETRPFKPLDTGLKIVPDDGLFLLDDERDHCQLLLCVEALNDIKQTSPLKKLIQLSEKYPNHKVIQALLVIGYKINQEIKRAQKCLQEFKDETFFLPLKLLRWWHIFECVHTTGYFSRKMECLQKLAPKRETFFLTEFSIWGLIRICTALDAGRFVEAESHFLSLINVTEMVGSGKHWALDRAESILQSGCFLRRLKIRELYQKSCRVYYE
ncbi:MAG: hypothetical protein K1060chlam2_01003 [Chlamydiae bacterium]|nr:hypothetical protein [Chlamydiota bacterium]